MPAVCALISQYMAIRDYLRHWCDFSFPQATAANHEIAQAIQQAIVNIVFRGRGQNSSPVTALQYPKICFDILEQY